MYIYNDLSSGRARRNLHERIAHDVGAQIVQGEYKEADLLPTEIALADRYGVSRTAVREAFRILAAKGLTTSRPKIGTRVRSRGDWNLLDPDVLSWHLTDRVDAAFLTALFDVRAIIEPQAAAAAGRNRTDRHLRTMSGALQTLSRGNSNRDVLVNAHIGFHFAMLDASDNPLFRSIGALTEGSLRFYGEALTSSERANAMDDAAGGGYATSTSLQSAIFAAIQAQDSERAQTEVSTLIAVTRQECFNLIGGRKGAAAFVAG